MSFAVSGIGSRSGGGWAVGLALLSFALPLRAAELVTLHNGFSLRCDHHAAVEGRTRLFLSKGENSYIEFAPEEIAGVDVVSDPPAIQPPAQSSAQELPASVAENKPDAPLSAADLREMLAKAGGEHDLDVDLLASLVKAESGGNVRAVSRTGAKGLMQLMPGTARDLGVADTFKADQNVRGGSAYLDELLRRYHDNLALALAAYNAGPAAVDRYHAIPPFQETRAYGARVIHEFNRRVRAREAVKQGTGITD